VLAPPPNLHDTPPTIVLPSKQGRAKLAEPDIMNGRIETHVETVYGEHAWDNAVRQLEDLG
jgi:hypothetical protein